jgi:hypothetical protein
MAEVRNVRSWPNPDVLVSIGHGRYGAIADATESERGG